MEAAMSSYLYCVPPACVPTVVPRVVADHRPRADGRFIDDLDVFAENCAGADGYVPSDLGGSGNDCSGMNFVIAAGVSEQLCGSRETEARLGGKQDGVGGSVAGEISRDGRPRGRSQLDGEVR